MAQLLLAFFAGFVSFLSPCVLPLIPGYISYVSGSTLNELLESKRVNIIPTVLFTIGFSIVFIAFGATSTLIGNFVLTNSFELRIVSGAIIILFSLQHSFSRKYEEQFLLPLKLIMVLIMIFINLGT